MGRKVKVLPEIKIKVVEAYLRGERSVKQIAYALQVSCFSVEEWIRKYRSFGSEGLIIKNRNTCYPQEVKVQAVTDYIRGEGSLYDICARYNISSHTVLTRWIKKYNGHKIFKTHNTQGAIIMTNGRKTTYEERIQIVGFCITNNDDYQATANKFKVSYQQVYTWVRKYKTNGYEALLDRRGKHKEVNNITEAEKLSMQLKLIEAENKRLKMENDFLKKLKEVERRR